MSILLAQQRYQKKKKNIPIELALHEGPPILHEEAQVTLMLLTGPSTRVQGKNQYWRVQK